MGVAALESLRMYSPTEHARGSRAMRAELVNGAGRVPSRWLSGGDRPRVTLASRPRGTGRAVRNEDDIIALIRCGRELLAETGFKRRCSRHVATAAPTCAPGKCSCPEGRMLGVGAIALSAVADLAQCQGQQSRSLAKVDRGRNNSQACNTTPGHVAAASASALLCTSP